MTQSTVERFVEERIGMSIPDGLLKAKRDGLTNAQTAVWMGVSPMTINNWKRKYLVEVRSYHLREPVTAGR